MGLLNKAKVYLVGGMQYVTDGRDWREKITPQLKEMGIVVFDPYIKPFIDNVSEDEKARATLKEQVERGEYDVVAARMKRVRNFDLRLCDLSDFIVAHINPSIASWGTAEELTTNVRAKKPIFLSVEGGKSACPLWIFGMIPHKYIYNNVEDIIPTIKKIDSGEKKIDSDRWKLLKEEYR